MKKLLLLLVVGFFAVVVAACSLPTLQSISISGQDVEFYAGEEFNVGDLKVIATLSDDTTQDVTSEAVVKHEINMDQAGKYTVTVTYKGVSETYEVTVLENPVVALTLENVNTEYKIGETVSFEGVVAKETLESGIVADANLATYDVVIKDAEGKEYTGAFAKVGKNTVKLSKGAYAYEFEVNVAANLYSTILDAVNVGVNNADKVASGTAVIDNEGYTQNFEYAFGENYTKLVNADGTYHYTLNEDGSAFGILDGIDWEGNPYMEPAYEPLPENLKGVDFRGVLNYVYDMYGVESLVENLALAGENAINYQEVLPTEVTDAAVYSFSYEIIIENFYYYFVNVEFTLDANTEVITEVKVEIKGYMFVYNEETGENEQPTEFAETPDFARVVTANQVIGERNAENPYPIEKLFINSFDVLDENGNKLESGATITAPLQSSYSLEIANINPETANPAIDKINVLFLDSEGFEVYSVFGYYEYGYVTFTAYQAGTYQLVISSANVNYTFQLEVAYAPLESFVAGVYSEDWNDLVEGDSATVFAGQTLQFGAIVNDGADDSALVSCEGAVITEGEYYEFVASEVGTYVITLTSNVNPAFTATINVEVVEAPSVAELLTGKYQFTSMMLGTAIYTFEPESEGAVNGQLTIAYNGAYVGTGEAYFTYQYVDGWLSVDPSNPGSYNCPFSVELGESFNLLCTYNYFPQGELVRYQEVEEGGLNGNYTTIFTHPMNQMQFNMVLTFNADGTGFYSLMNGMYEGSFAYESNEGVITFSDVFATFGTDVQLTATVDGSVVTCTTNFVIDGMELTLEYLGAAEENETTTTPVVGENTVFVSMRGTELYFTPEESCSYTISIDGSVAGILIESTDEWYLAEYTLDLEANVPLLIVIVTATFSTPEQNATLTITKN